VGFPLLFDTQPRPIAVDIPIEIPSRNEAALGTPMSPNPAGVVAPEERIDTSAPTVSTRDSLGEREEVVQASAATAPRVETPSASLAQVAPVNPGSGSRVSGSPAKTLPQRSGVADSAEPVRAAEAGAAVSASAAKTAVAAVSQSVATASTNAPTSERAIVQVGAFADNARAQEVRWKLERAGLKTYTHVAETSEGRRIRVRLGPFSSRADAEKAAERVKALDLPAAILTL
jgi:DedD protein